MTQPPLTTTLKRIWRQRPFDHIKTDLLSALGETKADSEPITYAFIARSIEIRNALRCAQAEPQYSKTWRLAAVAFAKDTQHIITNPLAIEAIDVAERYAHGEAREAELSVAYNRLWLKCTEGVIGGALGTVEHDAWYGAWSASGDAAHQFAFPKHVPWNERTASMEAAYWATLQRQKAIFIQMVGE